MKSKELSLIAVTWPIFIEFGLHILMRTVDVFMLSQVSDDAVAAVGVSNQIVMMAVMVFQFVAMGSAVVVSQYLGAKQTNEIDRLVGSALGLNFVFGMVVSIGLVLFSTTLLQVFNLGAGLFEMAQSYLTIACAALVVQALLSVTAAIIQTHGFTRHTMLVALGMNVLNIIGNYLFIFGLFGVPKLGVTGVAISTATSQLIGLAVNLMILHKVVGVRLQWRSMIRWQRDHVAKVLRVGVPSAAVTLSYNANQFVTTMFISSLGAVMLTTKIYTQNIMLIVMILGISLARGTQIIVGHLVGAGEQEEAYTRVLRNLFYSIGITLFGVLILTFFRVPLLSLFTDSSEIISMGAALLLVGFLLEPARNFNVILEKSLQATGDAGYTMASSVLIMWLFSVPLTYFLGIYMGYGLYGIWAAFIIDEWARGLSLYVRWRNKGWKKKSLVQRGTVST
ncbi:transporter [Cohnella kolymensis]|uniref:Transporter n=1 Tax=Cohnella kolymensis TaxID=1590652 RepID=A0ABR5A5Y1_9BACL|nr:MATE family efflux transporter [Cohnella kolymensis]KIL36437.1 transporter [Cohnella kolymensis]